MSSSEFAPSKLKRQLELGSASATSAGLAFAALNYLAIVSVASYSTGISLWLPILIGGLIIIIVAGLFAELNGLYPSAAGIRLYMAKAINAKTAVIVTFAYLTTVILVIGADAFVIGAAITHVVGLSSIWTYFWISFLLVFATITKLADVKVAGVAQAILTYLLLGFTTLVSIISIFKVHGPFKTPVSGFLNDGIIHGAQSLIFALFIFAAFEWVTTSAEEVREISIVSKSLFIAPLLIFITAVTFGIGLAHSVHFNSFHNVAYPQLLLGKKALGQFGEDLMLGITLITVLNTFNGGFLVASRFMYAASREGLLPKAFSKLNLKVVPWFSIIILSTSSLVISGLIFYTRKWLELVSVRSVLEALIYVVAGICVFRLRKKNQGPRPFTLVSGKFFSVFVIVIFSALAIAGAFSNPANPSKFSLTPFAIVFFIFLGSFLYSLIVIPRIVKKRNLERQASHPKRRPVNR